MNFNEFFGKNVTYDDIKHDEKSKAYTLQTVKFLRYILRVKVWIFFE